MRHKSIIICFFISLCFVSYGQVSIGVKASPFFGNGSALKGEFGNNTLSLKKSDYVGYMGLLNIGIIYNYGLTDNYSVQTEINFKNQGLSSIKKQFEIIDISYIDIPLLLQYKGTTRTTFVIDAGPSLKINMGSGYSYMPGDGDGRKSIFIQDVFKPLVITLNLGAGISRSINNKLSLVGEMRFGYDITSTTYKTEKVSFIENDWYFKNTYFFQLGIRVGLMYKLCENTSTNKNLR